MHQIEPTVGQWYLRPESGQKFEVIDIDDGDGMIEIQDEEGTLDQIDSETWFAAPLEITVQPHSFSAAFDNLAEPDEADGGDPIDPSVIEETPLRISQNAMDGLDET